MVTQNLIREAKSKQLTLLAKECKNIDEVIEVLKNNNKEPMQPTKQDNYFFYISIKNKKFILSYNFSLLNEETIQKIIFTPYIKFDIDEIHLDAVKALKCELFIVKISSNR